MAGGAQLEVWDTRRGHGRLMYRCEISCDGAGSGAQGLGAGQYGDGTGLLAVGWSDGVVRAWGMREGRVEMRARVGTMRAGVAAVWAGAARVVAADEAGEVRAWVETSGTWREAGTWQAGGAVAAVAWAKGAVWTGDGGVAGPGGMAVDVADGGVVVAGDGVRVWKGGREAWRAVGGKVVGAVWDGDGVAVLPWGGDRILRFGAAETRR